MKISIIILWILVSALGVSHAQNTQKLTFRTLFLDRPENASKTLYLFDGSKSQEIALPKQSLSPVYVLPAGTLKLVLSSESITKPEDIPTGSPIINVPEGITDFYLLFFSDPSNKTISVKAKAVDSGDSKLKPGETMWLNLTKHLIGGELGSEKLIIQPSSSVVMKSPIPESSGSYPANLFYLNTENKRTFPICQTVWTHSSQARWLGFVFQQSDERTPRILTFRDYRPVE